MSCGGEMMELKPCPNCDGKDIMICGENDMTVNAMWSVYCDDCGTTTDSFPEMDQAIKQWNTRPEEDRLQAHIAELESKLSALENDLPLQKAVERIDTLQKRDEIIRSNLRVLNRVLNGDYDNFKPGEVFHWVPFYEFKFPEVK